MASSRAKTAYGCGRGLLNFLRSNWQGAKFLTLTFKDNVTSRREAGRRFKPARDGLERRGVKGLGVWQRQKRGAWHVHLLISTRINIGEFRRFVEQRGWGKFVNIRNCGNRRRWNGGSWVYYWEGIPTDAELCKVGNYMARYLHKSDEADIWEDGEDKFSRVVTIGEGSKSWSVDFTFTHGNARAWRLGCEEFVGMAEMLGIEQPTEFRRNKQRPGECYVGLRKGIGWAYRNLIQRLGWEVMLGMPACELECYRWEHAPDIPF